MFSHGSDGGEAGMDVQGQASPMDTPSIWVRDEAQTLDNPLLRTVQRVGTVMTGTEAAWVVGCERR